MKLLFIDLETTGTNRDIHGIHQISGMIIINGIVKEKFNYTVAPAPYAVMDPVALDVCGVTEKEIRAYPHMHTVYPLIIAMLFKHKDDSDPLDKYFICGYNCQKFDAGHLAKWFFINTGIKYFKELFWSTSIDVMILATAYLAEQRSALIDFKQSTVAKYLGMRIDKKRLHDAEYDIEVCLYIYKIVWNKF